MAPTTPTDHRPQLNLTITTFGTAPGGDWRALLDLTRQVETAGVDSIVFTDNVVNGPDVADYPWGRFPTGPEADWLEPLTVLTAVAAATERLRLSTGVLVAPLRPAALLAKTVATLDALSGGRVDLGVGTGWQQAEFDAMGLDFDARGQLLTDTVAACRALWEGGPTTFESSTVSLRDVHCAPRPVQDRLPVWFSGSLHRRNVERIVSLGDGWIPIMGSTDDQIADGARLLAREFDAVGRGERPQVRAAVSPVRGDDGRPDLHATFAGVPALIDAGVTQVQVGLQAVDPKLRDVPGATAALVDAFHAAVGE